MSYSATSQAEGVWLSMGCVQPFAHLPISISIQQLKFAQDCRVANDVIVFEVMVLLFLWEFVVVVCFVLFCLLQKLHFSYPAFEFLEKL